MNKDIKAEWVKRLRSGEYKQGRNNLHRKDADGFETYCCLGILCEMAVEAGVVERSERKLPMESIGIGYGVQTDEGLDYSETVLPAAVRDWAGLDGRDPFVTDRARATQMNDGMALPFIDIAMHIERSTQL